MGYLRFKKVKFANFLSFGDEPQTYEFLENGLILIVGKNERKKRLFNSSNGSGKTSFINAIFWGLFGDTDKKIKSDSVVNNINKRNCFVEVYFDIDKDEYVIKRYRKHSEYKNRIVLIKNGKNITETTNQLTQNIIESLIGSPQMFLNSVVFSQEMFSNFLNLTTSERKNIIDKILKLETINEIYKKVKDYNNEIKKINENYIFQKEKTKKEKQVLEKSLIEYYKQCKIKKESIEKEIKNIKQEIEETSVLINKNNVLKILEIKKNISELKKEYDNENIKFLTIEKRQLLKEYIKLCDDKKNKIKEIKKLEGKINKALKNPKVCPVCGNVIEKEKLEDYVNKIKKDIKKIEKRIEEIKENQLKIKTEIQNGLEEKWFLQNKIKQLKEKIKEQKRLYKKEIKGNEFIQKKDENLLRQETEKIKEYKQTLENKIKTLEYSLKEIVSVDYVNKIKENIKKSENKIKEIEKDIYEEEKKIEINNFWLNILDDKNSSGVKKYIIKSYLTFLNARLDVYLSLIFQKRISVFFNVNLDEKIILENNEIEYKNLSGGEKKRIDIAINLTLFDLVRMNFNNTNILILDEILDKLDKEGQETILDILKNLSKKNSIFLVSHSDWLKELTNVDESLKDNTFVQNFFKQIVIVRKNKFSKINVVDIKGE